MKLVGFTWLAVAAGVAAIAAPQIYSAHEKAAAKKSSAGPDPVRRAMRRTGDLLASLRAHPVLTSNPTDKVRQARGREMLLRHEAKFLENKGQWDHRGQFLARTPGMDMWMDDGGLDFDYYRTRGAFSNRFRSGDVVHLAFAGGKNKLSFVGEHDTGSRTDFMLGKKQTLNVRAYYDVHAKSVYPGIDFHTHFDNLKPRYDLIVAPGASPASIKLRFTGSAKVSLNKAGDAIDLMTSVGEQVHSSLVAYQDEGAKRNRVSARFVQLDSKTIGVKVAGYDRNRALVIDPLVYGTYYGGDFGFDEVRDVIEDSNGGTYLTGDTQSVYFPAIAGPYGQYNLIGTQNAFLTKLEGDAYNHDYAAFIGGHEVDSGQYLKFDPNGNIWMAGTTDSPDFPYGSNGNTSPVATYFIGVPFNSDANTFNGTGYVTNGTFRIVSASGAATGQLQSSVTPQQLATALNKTIGANQNLPSPITVTSMNGTALGQGGVFKVQIPNGARNPFTYSLSTDCSTEIGPDQYGFPTVYQEGLTPFYFVFPTPINGPPYEWYQQCILERLGSAPDTDYFEISVTTVSNTGAPTTDTTKPIPYNADAGAITAALAALGNVGTTNNVPNVNVTGTGTVDAYRNPFTITFGKTSGGSVSMCAVAPWPATEVFPQDVRYQVRQSNWKFLLPFGVNTNGVPTPRASGAFVLDGPNASQESLGFQQSTPEYQGDWGWAAPGNNQYSPNYQHVAPGMPAELFQGFDIRQSLASDGSVDIVLSGTTTAPLPEMSSSFPGNVAGYMLRYKYTGNPAGADALTLNTSASAYIGNGNADNGGIAIDLSGNAYVTGTTYANKNIECGPTSTYFQTGTNLNTNSPGQSWQGVTDGDLLKFDDIYVRQYNYSGQLVWSGFLGGHLDDSSGGLDMDVDGTIQATGSCIAIDQENAASNATPSVYVTGISRSYDFPRTKGTYGQQFEDSNNIIVTKVSNDGSKILFSTNLEEAPNTGHPLTPFNSQVLPAGIAVDAQGDVYMTGNMHNSTSFPDDDTPPPMTPPFPDELNGNNSPSMPTTPASAQPPQYPAFSNTWTVPASPELGTSEPFIEVLSYDASTLIFGSYLGGQLDDRVYAPYVDGLGDCWIFGWTESGRQYWVPGTTAPTERQIVGQELPNTPPNNMISPSAFKHYSDEGGDGPQMGYPSATYIDKVAYGMANLDGYGFGSPWYPLADFPLQWTLPFPGMPQTLYARDGWVVRIRVGESAVADLTLNPTTIPGGGGVTSQGTITLSQAAPAGGATVTVTLTDPNGSPSVSSSFSNTSEVNSTTVVIPAGATTGTFLVYGEPVVSDTPVTVAATYQSTVVKATLTVTPWLQQFQVNPSTVVGGNPATGTIILTSNAPAGGLPITVTSNDASIVATQSFSVPAGTSNYSFQINTTGVTAPVTVNLTASVTGGGYSITEPLTIDPPTLNSAIVFNPASIAVGSSSTGTLTLNGEVGANTPVTLSSSVAGVTFTDTAGNPITSTNPLVIPIDTNTVQFIAVTASTITAPQTTITATTTINGASQSASGIITFSNFNLTGFSPFSPSTIINAGDTATATLTISQAAPTGGVTVNLQATTPGVVAFGQNVTVTQNNASGETGQVSIPAGSSSATFSVIGMPLVNFQTTNIIASRATTSITQNISVNALAVSMTLSPDDIIGGSATSTGQITIPQPVPVSLTFAISSNIANLGISPTTATILAGYTTTTDTNGNILPSFTLTPPTVTKPETGTVSAVWSDFLATPETGTVTSMLSIEPVGISQIVFAPDEIKQRTGTTSIQSITLTGPAPAGGLTITLTQPDGTYIRGLPSMVTVPAGMTTWSPGGNYVATAVSRTIADTIQAMDPYGGIADAVVIIDR